MTTSRPCSDSARQRPAKPRLATLALFAALAALAAAPAFPEADTAARDSALCASLTTGAREALSLGCSAEAAGLLDEALSFVPSDPDANYLRALLGLSAGDSPASVVHRLEAALAGGGFRLYTQEDARLLLASMLVRTRRPAEALRLVASVPAGSQSLYVESVARRLLGDDAGAARAVLASLRRYPADPRAVVAWLRAVDRPFSRSPSAAAGRQGDSAAVVTAAFASLPVLKEIDPAILVALAPYAGGIDEARLLVREYRAMGGSGADATVLALGYGLLSESRAIAEMLSGDYVPTIDSIRKLYSLVSGDDGRSLFIRSFGEFDGIVETDDDRDGYGESATRFVRGLAAGWVLDADQDGVPELEAEFSSGAPAVLRASSGTTSVTVRYERWPYAAGVEFTDAAGRRTYSLGPAALPLPLVDMRPVVGPSGGSPSGGSPYTVERAGAPLPSETAVASIAYSARREAGGVSETVELVDGVPSRSWWRDSLGRHGYATYAAGLPDDEVLDLDGNGVFEARRVWRLSADGGPVPARIEADLDGDGLFEYRESLSEPFIKAWDYDGDGAVDLTLEDLGDGAKVYRFGGRAARGRRIEAVYRDGRIVSVSEGGAPVPLVADAGGSVVWIGRKPFDFGPSVPPPGFGSRSGISYSVVAAGGVIYAQVLD